jgi:hypothetical protein
MCLNVFFTIRVQCQRAARFRSCHNESVAQWLTICAGSILMAQVEPPQPEGEINKLLSSQLHPLIHPALKLEHLITRTSNGKSQTLSIRNGLLAVTGLARLCQTWISDTDQYRPADQYRHAYVPTDRLQTAYRHASHHLASER